MRSAIVTGATSGIGRAATMALAGAGWWVLASGRDGVRGEEVGRQLGDAGDFVAGDLTEAGMPERLVERTGPRAPLGLLVNCAGAHFLATLPNTRPEQWDDLMALNLRAAALMARAAIPPMQAAGGGVVINVSSEAGIAAVPGQVAYNVSKAALLMLTQSIAVDHANDGIRAVSICPGTTRTALVEDAIASAPDPRAHEQWLASARPAKRLGKPEEIAAAIVFAASDEVSYMTGSHLVIDGGYTAM
ncbi:MAG TPA: SDR family oxidoreductase [Gaiellaceae bacterium]|jgi:NAD(P)-dependent dehydrogenase (short-subunit alcohol dehydrogenase family)|nr:SDR family oxidoreductase [Gaiellaceae bacterium]